MDDTCLPGLQGFPVQITGWSGFTDRVSIVTPNDIQLQFSPIKTPTGYNSKTGEILQDGNGNSTFFMNGTQFRVRQIRISKPKQEGLSNQSGDPFFEFQIWGSPVGTVKAVLELAVLIIPVFIRPVENEFGKAFLKFVVGSESLESVIPSGKGVDVVKYTTCVETDTKTTVKISVAYWSNGSKIEGADWTKGFNPPPAGIPDIFGFRVLSSFIQFADELKTKRQRNYEDINTILQPYSNSVSLSAISPEFKSSFRLIQNFEIKRGKELQDTSAYKCIAIDRSRDIKGGKLLIDPSSGRRLDEEMREAEAQEAENLDREEPSIGARSLWLQVCVIIGTIIGLGLLFGLIWMVSVNVFTRKSIHLPPINSATAATMARMPEGM